MILEILRVLSDGQRIPRESGDDPFHWGPALTASRYSPRERG